VGKGSKKVTVGYRTNMGMHVILCHGPIDKITRLTADEKIAWQGSTTGGRVTVNQPALFGGDDVGREGGVAGDIDVEMGDPEQGKNDYLLEQIGPNIPAYRRVVGLVFRHFYFGNSLYVKPWRARGTRIHTRQDGIAQWYDAKAEVGLSADTPPDGWYTRIKVEWLNPSTDGARLGYYLAPTTGPTIFNNQNNPAGNHTYSVPYEYIEFVWRSQPLEAQQVNLRLQFGVGTVSSDMRARALIRHYTDADYTVLTPKAGSHSGANADGWFDVRGLWPDNWYFDIPGASVGDEADMNPAHIIRECLTDPDWGMGYTDDDIDDDAFAAAADTLYAEELGMSLLWDRQTTIEDFIGEVVRHIDGALFVSRKTGKFVLKLTRDDYDPATIPVLDESNIEKISDPSRPAFGELVNSVTVNFWSRANGKDDSLTVDDTAGHQMVGAPIPATMQYPGFTNRVTAAKVAARDLRALSNPFLQCTIYAGEEARELDIGDCFVLNWLKWGIEGAIMRVTGFALAEGKSEQVRLTCVEDVFSTPLNAGSISAPPAVTWESPSKPPEPVAATSSLVFEAPYWALVQEFGQRDVDAELADNPEAGYLAVAAAKPASAMSAKLWTDDGGGYNERVGFDFAGTGTLAAALDRKATAILLQNTRDLSRVEVGALAQIGAELVRVDAIDVPSGAVTIGRGILDTVPMEHPAGTRVFFWQDYNGSDPTQYAEGETINAKITAVSPAGSTPVGTAPELSLEFQGRAFRPYPPGNLTINGDSYLNTSYEGELTIDWAHRDRLQQTGGEFVDHFAGDIGPEAGTTYRFRLLMNGVEEDEQTGLTEGPVVIEPSGGGICTVEVYSIRDGVESLYPASHSFPYVGTAGVRFTEDGDSRYSEDGDFRALEE
jgi:hypothetical protein